MIDFTLAPEHEAIRTKVRDFVENHIKPAVEPFGHRDEMDPEKHRQYVGELIRLRKLAVKEGLWLPHMPKEWGGMGLGHVALAMVQAEAAKTRVGPWVFNCQAPDEGNMHTLVHWATPEQKEKYLKPLCDGVSSSCFAMTEPEVAGSDPTLIRTHAIKDGDEWIINGHKWFISGANSAKFAILIARTEMDVPEGSRGSRGRPIVNMFPLIEGEKINVVLPLTGDMRTFPADHYVFMATSMGTVKKTSLDEFDNPRKGGIIAVNLDEGDFLIGAALTDGKHDVMLFSDGGKAVRFDENDVRPLGRSARGVRGMMIDDTQSVIAMLVAEQEVEGADATDAPRASVLTATENGYGKRTSISEYTRHGRGTKGMIAIQQTERNGKVVAATLVQAEDEIMLITDTGVLVRTRVAEIREMGRATQGVTLIGLDEGAKLSGLQRIVENDAENGMDSEGEAGDASEGNDTDNGTPTDGVA